MVYILLIVSLFFNKMRDNDLSLTLINSFPATLN